jgi:hypothetical protein
MTTETVAASAPVHRLVRCREYAAIPFIYGAFCLLRLAAIIIGKSSPGKVGPFYDSLEAPNAPDNRGA